MKSDFARMGALYAGVTLAVAMTLAGCGGGGSGADGVVLADGSSVPRLEIAFSRAGPLAIQVAWSDDPEGSIVMAMRHRELPYWGVQFHPESVLTVAGPQIVTNFLSLCERWKERRS